MSPDLMIPFSRPVPADEAIAVGLKSYPPLALDWSDLEDDIADTISDSMDMDWTSRIGARAVVEFLKALGARIS